MPNGNGKGDAMMKRYGLFFMVLIAALLTGCVTQIPQGTDTNVPSQTEVMQTEEPTFPVDDSVFYFSNELEYNRLYSQNLDGTDLRLVLDEYCMDVRQVENNVYYRNGKDLCVYHVPTGNASVFIEDVFDYAVDGNDLVYYRDLAEPFRTEIRYRNLKTGNDVFLESIMSGGSCDISGGMLYYAKYDEEYGIGRLCACDLQTFETKIIAKELSSFHRLQAVPGGVYFEGVGEDYTYGQYFSSADGKEVRKLEKGLTDTCQMFYASGEEMLCVYSIYDDVSQKSCIHRHNADGTVTDILQGLGEGYFTVEPLDSGMWLVKHSYWYSADGYSSYEAAAWRQAYFLLDAEGNITSIDATGEMGQLFADGDFPVMDSSTARKPVTAGIYTAFVSNHGHEGAEPLCSTTHGAWLNIADRKVDIALLAAPTKEELEYLDERGVRIEMKLYGGDGLVFIGNAENPVQNLSREQIIGIYQGNITNWNEVGGPDQPITVYYRDDQSGSQRLFEKMVFKGLELPDYEKLGFAYMDEMSTIVDIVIEDPYSIGYSIMTYLDDVYENENLKIFAVDGIIPSEETVKNSAYPYHTQGYVVIRSDEPENSPARRLYNWFGSRICDELLIACGITPLQDGVG